MNLLQLPAASMDALQNLQIWNNAAFVDGDEALPLRPISGSWSASQDDDLSKENRMPEFDTPPPLSKKAPSPAPAAKSLVAKKPSRVSFKEEPAGVTGGGDDEVSMNVDEEIEEVKKEISRLSSRLEALRIKKAEKDLRATAGPEKRGRIVPAKFLETKQWPAKNLPATPGQKRVEQGTPASATSFRRRGLSLGPLEIFSVTPAKVLDLGRGSTKKADPKSASKKTEATPASTQSSRRRGLSLGPLEIINAAPGKVLDPAPARTKNNHGLMAAKKREETPASAKTRRRGVSLGPLEIHETIRSTQQDKPKGTPIRSVQSCQKPSFQKLAGIKEEKETSSVTRSHPAIAASGAKTTVPRRGLGLGTPETAARAGARKPSKLQGIKEEDEKGRRSSSASPKPQCRSGAKALELRKGVATVGASKPARRAGESPASLKPKALFQDGGTGSAVLPSKRPLKRSGAAKGRVVASRYSLAATARTPGEEPGSKRRKWSLPELGKEEEEEEEEKTTTRESSGSLPETKAASEGAETTVVDQMEEEVAGDLDAEKWARSILRLAGELPKIRNLRCGVESPRDSGCAKRVAQLVDRKPLFPLEESTFCQALNFEEDEDEDEDED